MKRFRSWDGTELAYRVVGSGSPLLCVPGGPGQAVEYLGELGELGAGRSLILLDNRGTGASQVPADPATYRVDRLIEDIEALRGELGLDRIDLFGHSASGGTCMHYAARHPHRLAHLVLVAPSLRVTGLRSDIGVDDVLAQRRHEPWYAEAHAALNAESNTPLELERHRRLASPLLYGEWTDAARAQADAEPAQFTQAATTGFYADFEPDPTLPGKLADLTVPVLLVAGEYDIWPTHTAMAELATLFTNARLTVMPRVGHFPWVDQPAAFATVVENFLSTPSERAPQRHQ